MGSVSCIDTGVLPESGKGLRTAGAEQEGAVTFEKVCVHWIDNGTLDREKKSTS